MARMLPAAIVIGVSVATASCMATPYQRAPSQRAQAELAKALAGRTPGPALHCIPNYRTTNMEIIDDSTILFNEGRTVYLQRPRGACNGISSGSFTLVTRPFGVNQLCDGDINHLTDLRTGMLGGSCVFGPFVPYTRR